MNRLPFNLSDRGGAARRLVAATIGSAGVRLTGMALTFLVGIQLARYLGPAEYGVYGTVMAIAAILTVPAQLGLPQLITRELSASLAKAEYARARAVLIWFAFAVLIASLVMVAIGLIGYVLASNGLRGEEENFEVVASAFTRAYMWGLATIPLTALLAFGMGATRGAHHVVSSQVPDALVRPALLALLLLVFALFGYKVDAATAMALQATSASIALVLCALHVARAMPAAVHVAKTGAIDLGCARTALPMTVTEILRVVEAQYPVLLLGLLAAIDEVGVFRVALAVAAFIGLPSTLINIVVMPYAARWHVEGNTRNLQLIATFSAVAAFASALAITCGIYLFGGPVLTLMFGTAFAAALGPLVLMGIGYTVSGFFGSAATLLNMSGQERTVTCVHAVGLLIGITFTIILFSRFGIAAAAIAIIVAEAIKGIWMTYAARRALSVDLSLLSIGRIATSFRVPTTETKVTRG